MEIKKRIGCSVVKKQVCITFDRETVENGNGPNAVSETPFACNYPNCPNVKQCPYMQEQSYWE